MQSLLIENIRGWAIRSLKRTEAKDNTNQTNPSLIDIEIGKSLEDLDSNTDLNDIRQSLSTEVFQEKMEYLKRRREWIETISRR